MKLVSSRKLDELSTKTVDALTAEKPKEASDKDIKASFDKANLDELEAANKYRKRLVTFTCWTVGGLTSSATIFMGFYLWVQRGHIEASVMISYFGSIVAEVVGILYVIARYLFPSSGARTKKKPRKRKSSALPVPMPAADDGVD